VALDVSNSMLAVDGERSRLDLSVSAIRRIAEALEGARIGLVVFKGQAEQLLPLTEDRYALETALRYAGPSVMTSPGTGLEEGIEKSMGAFSGLSHFYRAIILFSDGEIHSGNPTAAAAKAGKAGIALYAVAVGSDQGASVTLPGDEELKDGEGRPVITRVDLDTLEKIAEASGGEVFRLGDREEKVVEQILGTMKGQREGNMVLGMRREKKDRYRFFLVLAIVFLSLSLAVRAIRWKNIL